MNRILRTSTTALIVAVGLGTGHSSAEIGPSDTTISQSTCEARFVRSGEPIRKLHVPTTSDRVYERETLNVDDWSSRALNILAVINNTRLDGGELNIVDCAGSRSSVRVRTRHFELENINRNGGERQGWRFNAEAENTQQAIIRVVRLTLPPNHTWQLNAQGDGLIAEEILFHPLSAEDAHWFNRVRKTEVTLKNNELFVVQHTSTDNQFDSLHTWTLNTEH